MMRIWIDTETGTYGVADTGNLVIVEVHDDDSFFEVMEGASDSEIRAIGAAFGTPV